VSDMNSFDIVIIGLTITSSWGNGHASTFRSLVQGLAARGWRVLFLECDAPWYAANRDQPAPAGATTELYVDFDDLTRRFTGIVRDAVLVMVGSYTRDGVQVGEWVTANARGSTAFYDIDTPITLAKLEAGDEEYISADLIPQYDAYLSFTGGSTLDVIEKRYGSPMARVLYCSVDPGVYRPVATSHSWDLGYLGTYSADRQSALNAFLLEVAHSWPEGRFAVAGSMYPDHENWPANVDHIAHLAPGAHAEFYGAQRFTLNLTREAMKQAGYSPSVRIFEAAACGAPVISDWWPGLDSVLQIGTEILVVEHSGDVLRILMDLPEERRLEIAHAARRRVLSEHTHHQRAAQLEDYLAVMGRGSRQRTTTISGGAHFVNVIPR